MSNLKFNNRDNSISNSAKKARKAGKVPGIVYGRSISNLMFEVGELELEREISCQGEHGILSYNLGAESNKALLKEVQRDPVTHKIIHVDLEDINGDETITSSVPIHFVGEDILSKRGIVLQKEKDSVKIECVPDKLPKYLELNLKGGNVGSVYRLGDLEVASEISIVDDLNSVMASISYERKTVSEDMEAATEGGKKEEKK